MPAARSIGLNADVKLPVGDLDRPTERLRLVEVQPDILDRQPGGEAVVECAGEIARGNLSWLALVAPDRALRTSIITLGSRPDFVPIATTSDVATNTAGPRARQVCASRRLRQGREHSR